MNSQRGLMTALALAVGFLLASMVPAELHAQQGGIIQGTVVDAASGQPLAAVQVSVVGTQRGSVTNREGTFRIPSVPAGERQVRAQSLGFTTATQTVEVVTGQSVTVNFQLRHTVLDIEQIVVTGVSGETPRAKLPFTVDRLTAESLPVPTSSAASILQGKVAGVTVVSGSGRPGSAPSILLRGPTSINASGRDQEPLFIVDGVILGSSLVDLDALDIESIEVVKGAAAASLYGSRAANGVIQINTRRGTDVGDDQVRYTVRSQYGSSDLQNQFPLTQRHGFRMTEDGTRFIDANDNACVWASCASVSLAGQRAEAGEGASEWNTFQINEYPQTFDNVGRFFDAGDYLQNHIAVEGRSGGTNYHVSFSNLRESGVMPGSTGFDRYNFRANLDQSVADNFTLSASAFVSRSDQDQFPEGSGNPLFSLTRMPAGVDIAQRYQFDPQTGEYARDGEGNLIPDPNGELNIKPDPFNENANPLYEMLNRQFEEERSRVMASANLRWSPIYWMTIDGTMSYDRLNDNWSDFFDRGFLTARPSSVNSGHVWKFSARNEALNSSLTATMSREFGDFATRTQLRYLYEEQSFESQQGWGYELVAAGVPSLTALGAPEQRQIRSAQTAVRSEGYFASFDTDWRDKYILSTLVRRDGSSLFGADERWQTYYRVAGAWRLAHEDFFNFDNVNELKLRASIGTAGGRPNFSAQYETFSVTGGVVAPSTLGNRDLKPEFAVEQEYGIELIMFDRLSADLTYAQTEAEDQILSVPLPAFTGFGSQWINAGTLKSNTLEATLDAQLLRGANYTWSARVMFDRTRQKITEMNIPAFTYGVSGQQMGDVFFAREGEPLGTFYGVRFATECSNLPEGARPFCDSHFDVDDEGFLVFVGEGNTWRSANWGQTGEVGGHEFRWGSPIPGFGIDHVTGEETTFLPVGKTTPDYTLSFGSTLRYGDFEFYGLLDAVQGFDVWNQPLHWATFQQYNGEMDQTGKPEEEQKPLGYYSALYNQLNPNNAFVEDASFVKLRELAVRYRVGQDHLQAVPGLQNLSALSLGLTGTNLYTWTDYRGYDPEVGRSGGDVGSAALARVDGYSYPNFRTWTFEVQVSF